MLRRQVLTWQSGRLVCRSFEDWEGFSKALWVEREELGSLIAKKRKSGVNPTFKHERQVQAEAEALLLIKGLRNQTIQIADHTVNSAFFVSYTRIIDEIGGEGLPVTMRPESALQWVSTLVPGSPDEYQVLVDNLLWELSERGYRIVNPKVLRNAFAPLATASRESMQEEATRHGTLIAQRFGQNPEDAFNEIGDIEFPLVAESYYAQKAGELERQLIEERARSAKLIRHQMSSEERAEYEALKVEKRKKHRRTQRRKGVPRRRKRKRKGR